MYIHIHIYIYTKIIYNDLHVQIQHPLRLDWARHSQEPVNGADIDKGMDTDGYDIGTDIYIYIHVHRYTHIHKNKIQ